MCVNRAMCTAPCSMDTGGVWIIERREEDTHALWGAAFGARAHNPSSRGDGKVESSDSCTSGRFSETRLGALRVRVSGLVGWFRQPPPRDPPAAPLFARVSLPDADANKEYGDSSSSSPRARVPLRRRRCVRGVVAGFLQMHGCDRVAHRRCRFFAAPRAHGASLRERGCQPACVGSVCWWLSRDRVRCVLHVHRLATHRTRSC